ncbi:zinc finger SWIM domain-containing protein 8 homolog [Planococcus citri]|uniref:zinc finger SWIM domain-containing protein 8 homolog n=1 Tax=Planococcus citri TaxID=170843 RepID=UPI0031FA1685
MDNLSPTNFSRLMDNRSLQRNRSSEEMDPEESLNSEEETAFEKWNPDVETVNINWKGWKRSEHPKLRRGFRCIEFKRSGSVLRLSELAARCVAMHIPFEMVEKFQPPVPEELQQRITFWSFPEWDDDICLYTCLANSNDDEFLRGEILFENENVFDVIQIGFHLNATVRISTGDKFSVSISFDRRRITSCICTCKAVPLWCCHIVAVCLLRIYNPEKVQLRPPISESLTQLNRDQLQKFSQYLVSSLPEQYLQTAQRLLDDLNSGQPLPINTVSGAPDTTAGASVFEHAMWCLDDHQLHLNVKKQINRFGNVPPMVFSDVNMLTNNIPAIINEYNSMLRPMKIGEPDSIWNLLSIVRDMFCKNDRNALPLLEIITDEMANCVQVVLWWFANKSGLNGDCGYQIKYYYNGNSNSYIYQASAARLCDEIVSLWRLAALNPAISPKERASLCWKFKDWHFKIIDLIWNNWKHTPSAFDLHNFPGFKPCVEACKLTWVNFPLPGITYRIGCGTKKGNLWMYESHPFTFGIDIKYLKYIKYPTESLLNALQSCFIHVERIRNVVSKIISKSPVPSDLPDGRTIKYLKEHFSSTRDEVHHFVTHLITMADTWVNDETDDGESYSNMNSLDQSASSNSEKHLYSLKYGGEIPSSANSSNISPHTKEKITHERNVNYYIRRKMANSSICAANLIDDSNQNYDTFNIDDCLPSAQLEWEVYDTLMEEYSLEYGSSHNQRNIPAFFDTRHLPAHTIGPHNAIFESFSEMDNVMQSLIARAEGLWAFGHVKEACYIARLIAEDIISDPPDQKVMCSGAFVKPKRRRGQAVINPVAHRLTFMAVEKMELYRFLLNLLSSCPEHYDIAFRIGLLGLELPRAPASIKPLEVKLFHLENDIADILRKIPLTEEQFKILRVRLEKLKAGTYKARGHKLLPNALTSYILDVTMINGPDGKSKSLSKEISESLCFEAALVSLSLKPDVCEYEHSLLIEGLRRQRCDLALRMLDLYKDEPKKVFKIMDVIIDQEIDPNMKKPLHLWYYQDKIKQEEHLKVITEKQTRKRKPSKVHVLQDVRPYHKQPHFAVASSAAQPAKPSASAHRRTSGVLPPPQVALVPGVPPAVTGPPNQMNVHPFGGIMPGGHNVRTMPSPSTLPFGGMPVRPIRPAPTEMPMGPGSNVPPLRMPQMMQPTGIPPPYGVMQPQSQHSINGMFPAPVQVPGGPPLPPQGSYVVKGSGGRLVQHNMKNSSSRPALITSKSNKNKCGKTGCKRPVSIVYRNRSTEALAHSVTELAKSVLFRSGGHLASSVFVRESESGNVKTPNHVLHMCALQLAMYGLGISNNASSSWESRSYSPHVAMLTSLAIDIGAPAIMFIIENWPGHLTPSEANSLADRGSRSDNPVVVNLAAKLALSCLSHADKLNSHEIIQAINQCQTLGPEMQEKACCEVEHVAKTHSLQADVLFYISKLWYNVYVKDEPEELEDNDNAKAAAANPSKCPLPSVSYLTVNCSISALSGQSKSPANLMKRTHYLLTSYRLSMMAFQNLVNEINEEKAHYRFHCLPNYTADINRTMQIAKLLGDKWVHHFCIVVENTLVNPFLLYEVACGAAVYFARCNPSMLHYYICTVAGNLISKCETMFFQYLHNKLYNMAQYEEDEFINMAQLAHKAFSVSADGPYRFQEWLQSLRSANVPIRDLYAKITTAIEQEESTNKTSTHENDVVSKENIVLSNSNDINNDNDDDDDDDEDDDDDDDEDDDEDDIDDDVDNEDEDDDDNEDGNMNHNDIDTSSSNINNDDEGGEYSDNFVM